VNKNLFKSDKNYILKKVQIKSRNKLLKNLIFKTIKEYEKKNNSLGIVDEVINSIKKYKINNKKDFYFFYNKIAAIYRFKYGENQLRIIWDGRNHFEFYEDKWKKYFKKEIDSMLEYSSFIKIMINLTALNKRSKNLKKFHYKLSDFIRNKFQIQVFKRKGLVLKTI